MKKAIIIFAVLFSGIAYGQNVSMPKKATQCKGVTVKGQPCKSTFIIKGTDFCNAHNPTKIKCSGVNSKKQPCGMAVKVKGDFCKFHAGVSWEDNIKNPENEEFLVETAFNLDIPLNEVTQKQFNTRYGIK